MAMVTISNFEHARKEIVSEVDDGVEACVVVVHRDLGGQHLQGFNSYGKPICWCEPHLVDVFDMKDSESIIEELRVKELKN